MIFSRLTKSWDRFFFFDLPAETLGYFRIILFSTAFFFSRVQLYNLAEVDPGFFSPGFFFKLLHLPLISPDAMEVVRNCLSFSLLFACIGLGFRLFGPLSAALGFYFWGFRFNFYFLHHSEAPLQLALIIASFSYAAQAVSVDAWLRRKYGLPLSPRPAKEFLGIYSWPIQAAKLLLVFIFFSSIVWKILNYGTLWLREDIVARIFLQGREYYDFHSYPFTHLSALIRSFLLSQPLLTKAATICLIISELCAPMVLVSSLARKILLPAWFIGVTLVRITTGIHFEATLFPLFCAFGLCPANDRMKKKDTQK